MSGSLQQRLLLGASLSILAATAAILPAHAQGAPAATEELEEIIVTGSRIARPAEQSPVPVTAIGEEVLEQRGITAISDALARVPALQNTRSVAETTNGLVTANLRGLGANRTLVLVNGRRHVSGVAGEASVDLSTIPSALIERVDVLTGGASAVYGSDAVTGVVNFVLKKDFEGQEVRAQYGLSEEGDADRFSVSATVGRNFDNGKGNAVISVSAFDQKELRFGDRSFSRGNGIDDDVQNPDLFVQDADLTPALRAAGVTAGARILSLTGAQQAALTPALVSRAQTAVPRRFINDPRFALSSIYGIIGFAPTGGRFPVSGTSANAPNIDLDNNGVRDCVQNFPGRRGFGCLVIDPATGQLRPFRDGTAFANNDQSGGDGTPDNLDRATIVPNIQTQTADLNLNYEVSPYFKPFVEAKVVRNKARLVESVRTFDDAIPIRYDNPFVPAALKAIADAQIAANPALSASTYRFIITRDHTDVVSPVVTSERETYRVVGGFEGEFDNGWTYELSYNWGRTDSEDIRPNRLNDRFFAAIDAVRAPNGQIVCRSSLNPNALPLNSDTSPAVTAFNTFNPADGTCRPLNLFGLGAPSQEAQDFVTIDNERTSKITQNVFSGVLTGSSEGYFELPGGPLGFAAGFEYRKEESDFQVTDFERLGFTDRGGQQPVKGDFDVTEGFVEVNAPLLADLPGVHLLSVDGAYRYGDYSTVGGINTWKVGGVYAPIRDIRARGGYSRTVRAPNIFELFQPRSSALFDVVDPCDAAQRNRGPAPANRTANCAADGIPGTYVDNRTARINGTTGGNTGLKEETSTSYTVGGVLTPGFLPGFSLAVDYWNIKIKDAVSPLTAQTILNACYDAPSLDNPFCGQISRNRAAGPTQFTVNGLNQTVINFARFEAAGVDIDLAYNLDLEDAGISGAGELDLGLTGTWYQKNRSFQTPNNNTIPNSALGERFNPKWSLNPSVSWTLDGLTVSWFGFWQSRQALPGVEVETAGGFVPAFAPATWVHDASVGYEVTEQLRLTAGVNNLTDEEPFVNELNRPASAVGRNYYLRASLKW